MELRTDRVVIVLVTRWRNLLEEHALCRKRVNWQTTKNPSAVEKQRRRRRWEIEKIAQDIETTLIRFCADATHSHEIYTKPNAARGTDPLHPESFSRRDNLIREYYRTIRDPGLGHHQRGEIRHSRTRKRHRIVAEIVALDWRWLSALYKAIFPNAKLPPKRKTDYRVLRPRRMRRAKIDL